MNGWMNSGSGSLFNDGLYEQLKLFNVEWDEPMIMHDLLIGLDGGGNCYSQYQGTILESP
jgi:hypothetical protein